MPRDQLLASSLRCQMGANGSKPGDEGGLATTWNDEGSPPATPVHLVAAPMPEPAPPKAVQPQPPAAPLPGGVLPLNSSKSVYATSVFATSQVGDFTKISAGSVLPS